MDRAQIHTLEAFIAAMVIVGALLFASQATAVTPLSASTSNQHIENQQRTVAGDLLDLAAETGTLQEALTYWNVSSGEVPPHFRHAANPNTTHYTDLPPPSHPLHASLAGVFDEGVHAYNIELVARTPDGEIDSLFMIHMGTPSDNAVTATRTVTLRDDDPFSWEGAAYENISAAEGEFWAENIDEDLALYTVVEVRMTVWRM